MKSLTDVKILCLNYNFVNLKLTTSPRPSGSSETRNFPNSSNTNFSKILACLLPPTNYLKSTNTETYLGPC